MTKYNPDSWVIIKMTHKDQTFYKVLGGWSGGYIAGTSWRLSSNIEKCEYDISNDRWLFHNSSGSIYYTHPDSYGLRMSNAGIWNQMKEKYPDQVTLLDNCDWSTFNFGVQNVEV